MSDRKYSRVYHEAVDDAKFERVWTDDHALALWVRLLVKADQTWPSSADVPRSARRSSLALLVEVGLVDLLPSDRYRIHGLDGERTGRAQHAASAAQSRWDKASNADSIPVGNAPSSANGTAQMMPKRVENRREETSTFRRVANSVDKDPLLRQIRDAQKYPDD